MNKILTGALVGVCTVIALVLIVGMVQFRWPWEALPEIATVEVAVTTPTEARIVDIEPVSLDCRARIHAEVPVQVVRDHAVFGQVYRTDVVELQATGDVDTCVDGNSADVIHRLDGTTEIVIDGSSIVFVRPRVDAVASIDGVSEHKGAVGKFTDAVPGVSSDLGLTPLAFAYAQMTIGSSQCMQEAYAVTEQILIDAYRQQFIDQGEDPDRLSVRIDGEPLFPDVAPLETSSGVRLSVGDGGIVCSVASQVGATPSR